MDNGATIFVRVQDRSESRPPSSHMELLSAYMLLSCDNHATDTLYIPIQVLQYVIGRFVLTSLTMLLQVLGMYSEGDYSLDSPHLYFTLLHSLSQTYALYSLFLFYYASAAEFKNIKPFEKFLSIKLIIFFSWWQGILIGFLVSGAEAEHGGVSSHNATRSDVSDGPILSRKINSGMSADQHTTQHMADGVQDLLICMEMLIAAIAFTYSFPVADFKVGSSVASVGGGAGGEEGSDGSEWRDSSGYLPSTLTPSTPGFSGIRRRGIVTPGIGAARGGVSAASLSGLEEGVPRSHDDVGVAEELLLGEQSVEETVMCPAASDTPLLAPEASVHDQSDSMCDESSAASERSRQHSRGEEPLDGRFLLRKSHSTSSLCSSDSNSNLGSARRQSQRSNGKSHHKSSMASPSLDDKRNSKSFLHVARKFNWKDSSDRSLYSHSSLSKKSAFQHGQSDRANGQRSACGKFFSSTLNFLLSCLDTLVVLFSSLLYYCSSLFLEEEDEGGGHSQSDRQKREGSSGPLAVVKHTPTRYYDYHYYHAPPVLDELLQQRGRFTVLQAIYLTLSMGDLRDDMVELLTLTIDSVVIIPSLRFRRWIKSGAQSH